MATTKTYAPPASMASERARPTRPHTAQKTLGKVGLYVIVILFLLFTLTPIYWIVLSAFTPITELFTTPLNYFPAHPSLVNFQTVAQVVNLNQQFLNSTILSV